jgi:hypothetical protein
MLRGRTNFGRVRQDCLSRYPDSDGGRSRPQGQRRRLKSELHTALPETTVMGE